MLPCIYACIIESHVCVQWLCAHACVMPVHAWCGTMCSVSRNGCCMLYVCVSAVCLCMSMLCFHVYVMCICCASMSVHVWVVWHVVCPYVVPSPHGCQHLPGKPQEKGAWMPVRLAHCPKDWPAVWGLELPPQSAESSVHLFSKPRQHPSRHALPSELGLLCPRDREGWRGDFV